MVSEVYSGRTYVDDDFLILKSSSFTVGSWLSFSDFFFLMEEEIISDLEACMAAVSFSTLCFCFKTIDSSTVCWISSFSMITKSK